MKGFRDGLGRVYWPEGYRLDASTANADSPTAGVLFLRADPNDSVAMARSCVRPPGLIDNDDGLPAGRTSVSD